MFDRISIRFWPGLYTWANTESYQDLVDKKKNKKKQKKKKKRAVQEGPNFTILTGPIFYGINQSIGL